MKLASILPIMLVIAWSTISSGQVNPVSNVGLERRGNQVCTIPPVDQTARCYQTVNSLGLSFANDVEYLYPHIKAYQRSLRTSPKLPESAEALEMIGGALLLEPGTVEMVTEQLRQLNVRNVAVDIDGPKPLAEIPFAFTIEWKDRRRNEGTVDVTGRIQMVDDIFDLNLNRPHEFRDRLVRNITVTSVTGPRLPLKTASGDEVSSVEAINTIIVPFLAGKFVSIGRIGFNQLGRQLRDKLQDTVDETLKNAGPERPL